MKPVSCEQDLPFLLPTKLMKCLGARGYLPVMFGGLTMAEAKQQALLFWTRFREMFPKHGIFNSNLPLEKCVPFHGHIDEGRGKKKQGSTQVCVANMQFRFA